jgi:hypothetical protein
MDDQDLKFNLEWPTDKASAWRRVGEALLQLTVSAAFLVGTRTKKAIVKQVTTHKEGQ